ncbi:MAG: Ig-like domain-containing protein, partial [Anaerolineales bacterium]
MLIAFAGGSWWATQPRLLAVEPEPNATAVPGSASLRLSFSHLMQPESVLQRLSIQPPLPGNFHWEGKTLVFTPARAWQGGLTVRVRLSRGAQTQSIPHRRLNDAVEWWFQIGYPKVLYLFPFDGSAGLYLLDPFTATVERLSESGQEVFDYSLSANGATLLLTVREGSGSAIYRRESHSGQVERLLFFPHGQVRAAQLSHSGTYLAYELTELKEANAKTHVWVTAYPPQAEDQASRLGAADQLTRSPLWSAHDLLAYYDHTNRRYRFFDPATQSEVDTIQAETGEKAAWSPDGEMFLFAEILPQAGQYPT